MDYSKPTLFVISGPPGAGKSTYGKDLLPDELKGIEPYSLDKLYFSIIDRLFITPKNLDEALDVAIKAMDAKLSFDMENIIKKREHFVLETPLSHPKNINYLATFKSKGYQIHLAYVCLDSTKDCEIRVQHRVMSGGHYVSPEAIEQMYNRNLEAVDILCSIINKVDLYDNTKLPKLLTSFENGIITKASPEALSKTWIKEGLPQSSEKLKPYIQENNKNVPRHKL